MDEHTLKNEIAKVIRKVMKCWRKFEVIDRKVLAKGIDIIIKQIAQHTGKPVEEVGQHTGKVLDGFAKDFKKLPAEEKTHEDMILMIYIRYLYHMGLLD